MHRRAFLRLASFVLSATAVTAAAMASPAGGGGVGGQEDYFYEITKNDLNEGFASARQLKVEF